MDAYIDVHLIMNQTISITNLRNNIFDIFSGLEGSKKIIEVEKDGKKIGVIKAYEETEFDWIQYRKDVEEAVNYLSKFDWSDVLILRSKTKARRYKGW